MSFDEIKKRIVYMLRRTDGGNEIYIGSTSIPLKKRYMVHMYNAKNFIRRGYSGNNRLYARMNEIGLGNWRISPLVSRMCDMKTIREVEKNWIRILKTGLNTISPIREEETLEEYMAAYYGKNKEKILQQRAVYRENNRDLVRQCVLNSQMKNIESKKYYCDVCGLACRDNYALEKHLDTLKHSYNYMNSVD